MARQPKNPVAEIEYMPSTIVSLLKQITKTRYEEMRRSKNVTMFSMGFIHRDMKGARRLFVMQDNVCYESINTLFDAYTDEFIKSWDTKGIETYTMISFTPPKEQSAA